MEISILGPFCAFASAFTWAIGSAQYSRLSHHHSAFAINFIRALISLPLFVIAAFVVSGGFEAALANFLQLRLSHFGWFTLSMITSYALADPLFFLTTRFLGVPSALAIGSCFPIWTVLAGYFFGKAAITPLQLSGMLIAIGGVVTVILAGAPKQETVARFSWKGVLLAVLVSILWAVNAFSLFQGAADLLAPVGNTVRMILALLLSSFFSQIFMPGSSLLIPYRHVRGVFWVFILEGFGGAYLSFYGLSHSPLALGATLTSLAPVISVPIAVALRLEKFSIRKTIGVVLVVIGISLLVGLGQS
jgi:drug/metabolite transporter (DMT)-like permease